MTLVRCALALSTAIGLFTSSEAYAQTGVACLGWNTGNFFEKANVADVERCLKAGADPNDGAHLGWTRLHAAASVSASPAVITILVSAGADPNARDEGGRTPLFYAVSRNLAVFNALVDAGAGLNVEGGDGSTLLHFAALNEDPAIVARLLDIGGDPNSRGRGGQTPLHYAAAENQNSAVIAALVDAGADPNAQTEHGMTPLHFAASGNQNPEVIIVLLDVGAAADVQDGFGRLPSDLAKNNPAIRGSEAYQRLPKEGRPYPLPGPDPTPLQARGIILEFEVWPPDAEEIEPLMRKLRNAGLNPVAAYPLFKSWVFA